MAYVGIMGGIMYVNVFANLVDDVTIPEKDRILCINLVSIFINLGIILSCVWDLIINESFLPAEIPLPHNDTILYNDFNSNYNSNYNRNNNLLLHSPKFHSLSVMLMRSLGL